MGDLYTGGSQDILHGFVKMVNPSQRLGKSDVLAKIVKELVPGALSYKSGDVFVGYEHIHFPIEEYMAPMATVMTCARIN
jgi:hypothetical protein